ncbi:MAG: mannose-1-phosphate guanylyltransferase/mannose-6-phosphate isomerase [Sphingomonadales bacterium]
MSRQLQPKQLLPLCGTDTLLQQSARRVADPSRFAPPLIIANDDHRYLIAEQLRQIDMTPAAILLEPEGRNTAPAIALTAHAALSLGDDPLLLAMPSDHLIARPDAFLRAVDQAAVAVRADAALATFSITPTAPETGYGYIEQGQALAEYQGCFRIARFVEKPDRPTAQAYLDAGNYGWNSGIFLFRASDYLAELAAHAPALAAACLHAAQSLRPDGLFQRPDPGAWRAVPSGSIDYLVMEKTARAITVPVAMGWSDVGSWSALADVSASDAEANTLLGDVIATASSGNYLRSDGPLLAAVGLRDMVVVATPDAVLVADKAASQNVKTIVEALSGAGRHEHIRHLRQRLPWGMVERLALADGCNLRRIIIDPGARIGLAPQILASAAQSDSHHLVVMAGAARITHGETILALNPGDAAPISGPNKYVIENVGEKPLHLLAFGAKDDNDDFFID